MPALTGSPYGWNRGWVQFDHVAVVDDQHVIAGTPIDWAGLGVSHQPSVLTC